MQGDQSSCGFGSPSGISPPSESLEHSGSNLSISVDGRGDPAITFSFPFPAAPLLDPPMLDMVSADRRRLLGGLEIEVIGLGTAKILDRKWRRLKT